MTHIQSNQFIIQYIGEVFWDKRELDEENTNYLLRINEYFEYLLVIYIYIYRYNKNQKVTYIDTKTKGNASRFFNHSCLPNCSLQVLLTILNSNYFYRSAIHFTLFL